MEQWCRDVRNMEVIRLYPNLWGLLLVDGFSSHIMTYHAQEVFRQYRIMVLCEDSNTSQVNQTFDKHPAKRSKSTLRAWLPQVRNSNMVKILVSLVSPWLKGMRAG